MMTFETRTGPDFGAEGPSYPERSIPEWYRDAKLGIFVHWGLYSLPAWAVPPGGPEVPIEDAYGHHRYAEWYGNTVRIAGSPTWQRHQREYGPGTSYEDLADRWKADCFDAEGFVADLVAAGARYIVPTTKHHDGFCLWDTETTPFNSRQRGPRRDLVSELHDATRRAGLRFGAYFSGALDWHASDFPPIESDTDLFRYRRNDPDFARFAAAQVDELIDRFSPDILWNDIDWPDGGKGRDEFGVAALLERHRSAVPDGVVNDRWGVPFHGFLTREYTEVADILDDAWESTRGLGYSFGYNQAEDAQHSLDATALIHHLVGVVARGGNLLLNVGPRADGSIPEIQRSALNALGRWLEHNAAAVYGTRPWIRAGEPVGVPRGYTTSTGAVHVIVLDPGHGELELPQELTQRPARWSDGTVVEAGQRSASVLVPPGLRGAPAAVLTVEG